MTVKISIIVPIYNTERYLQETLDCITSQTFKDIEIILINDGSTDNCLTICREQAKRDSRIRIFSQDNAGVAVARNKGLELASGDYVIFLDSDDIFASNLLQELYNKALKTNADITICREKRFSENEYPKEIEWYKSDSLIPKEEVFSSTDYNKYILNFCILWPWDKLYKRSFLQRIKAKYPTDRLLEASEDLVFVGETLVKAESISIVNQYLINHRYHNTSLEALRNKYAASKALEKLYLILVKTNLYSKVEQSFKNLVLSYMFWHYSVRKNDQKEVRKIARKTMIKYKLFSKPNEYYYEPELYDYCKELFMKSDKFYRKFFSITKVDSHMIFRVLGIKFAIKRKEI